VEGDVTSKAASAAARARWQERRAAEKARIERRGYELLQALGVQQGRVHYDWRSTEGGATEQLVISFSDAEALIARLRQKEQDVHQADEAGDKGARPPRGGAARQRG
jgi:hypothetical protein